MAIDLSAVGAIAGLLTARHAIPSFVAGGVDILLGAASNSILSFSYTDNTSDQADNLAVEIADPDRTWMMTYLPKKGTEVEGRIKVQNWVAPGDTREVDCGVFWIDEIDFAGPPNVVGIKAVSIPVVTGIKSQKKFRAWENTTLQAIALQIGGEHGLALVWDARSMPKIKRTDQVGTPDLEYLRDKAKENLLSLKIYKRQLVIYSEEEYDAKGPVYVIAYGMSQIVSYSFSSKLDGTHAKASNSYVDPETGELVEGKFEAPEPPEGVESEDSNNEQLDEPDEGAGGGGGGSPVFFASESAPSDYVSFDNSDAGASTDATKRAKAKLRDKNKKEKECSFTLIGNPDYLSGLCVQLLGFGVFDGKWFISSSTHSIGASGYTTTLQLRGALSGY